MANTIKIKNSGTPSAAPSSLVHGELGLNYADGKIFFKNLSNTIVEFSTPPNLVVQNTAPANTSVIWADTSVTGVGVVPTGGTTGQVLSKASNTNYDAAWANAITSSDLALKANIASPTFTGTVTIPAGASISGFAPLANAALTGVPTAPTATAATNTTQLATTAFVTTANNLKANIASPALTGTPTAPTATAGTNTTQLATTEFANAAGGLVLISNTAVGSGVSSVTVSGCFSSAYDTYKVIYTGGTCSNAGTQTQARLGSTTAGYATNLVYQVWGSGTVLGATQNASAWYWVGGEKRGVAGGPCVMSFELTNPFAATYTMMNSSMYGADTTGGTTVGRLDNTASYTSVTLICEAGTFSGGNVYVYGYRK